MDHSQREHVPGLLIIAIIAVVMGVVVTAWLGAARRGLEYDELWTLQEYAHGPSVAHIFSDMATPNNHPLSSLLIRIATACFGDSEIVVRLPSLIAGTLLWVCLPFLTHRLTQRWDAALLATGWVAANAAVFHYGETARGYSLQTLLLFTHATLVSNAYRRPEREGRMLAAAVVAGAAAMTALPTTVIFILPIALVDIVARAIRGKKRATSPRAPFLAGEWRAVTAYTALAMFCAMWISHGAAEFTDAQAKFGNGISSLSQWLRFDGETIGALGLWPMTILAVTGLFLCVGDRTLWTGNATTACALATAWLFRAFPPRAYVPLVPLVCAAGAMGLCRALDRAAGRIGAKWRNALVTLAAAVPVVGLHSALLSWTPPDWKHLVEPVRDAAGPRAYIAYPAYDGYILVHYYAPDILVDTLSRSPAGDGTELVLTEPGGRITGVDIASGHTINIFCPERFRVSTKRVPGTSLDLTAYAFAQLPPRFSPRLVGPESVYFVQLGPVNKARALQSLEKLYTDSGPDRWQLINPHLEMVVNESGGILQAFLLATTNRNEFVRVGTNEVSSGSVPVSFYQLALPKAGP